MNIFLTGATGFLGKNFLEKLLLNITDKDVVYILLRREIKIKDARIKELFGCLEEIEQFKNEILECNYFFHIAANSTFGYNFDYDSVN